MLNWMRDYNAAAPPAEELTFHGIDPRSGARDRAMAENTLAILEENGPESRIVIWAHNIHISGREGKAGDYLRRELGDEAYLIGFAFNEGSFNSRTGVVDTFSVGPVPRNHYAYPLAQVSDSPVRFMDLATVAQADEELAAWLTTPQLSRNFAELYHVARVLPAQSHLKAELPVLFDALLYVEQSTPTDVLEAAR
jgi:erythromycin esterase